MVYLYRVCITLQIVILLTVSPEERRRRILGRGGQLTDEEQKLDKSELFQERWVVLKLTGSSGNLVQNVIYFNPF